MQALLPEFVSQCLLVLKKKGQMIPDLWRPGHHFSDLLHNNKTLIKKKQLNFLGCSYWLLAQFMRACEPLEVQWLDWFCAFFDLLTYTRDINYFSQAWSALRFPALGQLLSRAPRAQRRAEVCLAGPTELQSIQLYGPPSKITAKEEK